MRSWKSRVLAAGLVTVLSCGGTVEVGSSTTGGMDSGAVFRETAQRVFADCMRERGFDAVSTADGASEVVSPPGQEAAAEAAGEECAQQVRDLAPPRPLTEDELREFFELQLAVAGCLRGLGYSIPDPPSFERFAETQGGAWIPYGFLPAMDEETWLAVNERCPQP